MTLNEVTHAGIKKVTAVAIDSSGNVVAVDQESLLNTGNFNFPLHDGTGTTLALNGTMAVSSGAITTTAKAVEIVAEADCYVAIGDTVTATAASWPLLAGERVRFRVTDGDNISVIKDVAGTEAVHYFLIHGSEQYRPRLVSNIIPRIYTKLSEATVSDFGTGSHVVVDADTIEMSAGSAGRSFISMSLNLDAGQVYAVSMDVVSIATPGTTRVMEVTGGTPVVTATEGPLYVLASEAVNATRAMLVFQAAAAVTGALFRFGVGTDANDANTVIRVSKLQVEKVGTAFSGVSPYVYPGFNILLHFADDGYWNESARQYQPGAYHPRSMRTAASGVLISDSQSDGINEIWEKASTSKRMVVPNGLAGRKLETIASDINNILPDSKIPQWRLKTSVDSNAVTALSYLPPATWVAVFAGVNDVAQAAAGTNPVPTMIAAVETIVARCAAIGIKNIAFFPVTPWGGSASFSHASSDQMHGDMFRRWLKNYCEHSTNCTYLDVYDALEGATAGNLDAAYDSGDGLHLNAAGSILLAGYLADWADSLA